MLLVLLIESPVRARDRTAGTQQSGKTVEAVEFEVASATDRNDPK